MTKANIRGFTLVALLLAGACSSDSRHGEEHVARIDSKATSDNGLSLNGLSLNGLSLNGISQNGISQNGISQNGISLNGLTNEALDSDEFRAWFSSHEPEFADMVMTYVAICGIAEGESLSFTSDEGAAYTWEGNLGLAPVWSAGNAVPSGEQQLVTACLAAHASRDGKKTLVSIRGRLVDGTAISLDPGEAEAFHRSEGAFFGNLFTDAGVFVCDDDNGITDSRGARRVCAVAATPGEDGLCPPIVFTGTCGERCSSRSGSDAAFGSCEWNGSDYLPITTRLLHGP